MVKKLSLAALIIAMYVVHQDYWNWGRSTPMVLGFLPIGMAYHAFYSVAAAIMMAILVKFAWPEHLEKTEESPPESSTKEGGQ